MANRGLADNLIVPLRSRLARLRPPRPLRFARLLFLPLDSIIVPAAQWGSGGPFIPRSVIPAIAAAVHYVGEAAVEADAGGLLWPPAARVIADTTSCPNWEAVTALPDRAWLEIRSKVSGVLLIADRIRRVETSAFTSRILSGSSARCSETHPARNGRRYLGVDGTHPAPHHVLAAASRYSDHTAALSAAATSRSLANLPDMVKLTIGKASLPDAAEEAERLVLFLKAVEGRSGIGHARLRSAMLDTATQCTERFADGVAEELAPALFGLGKIGDVETGALENTARALHCLGVTARSLGAGAEIEKIAG